VSVGYSGDIFRRATAREAEPRRWTVDYFIPSEGGNQWFDMMPDPADAPNPEGGALLHQLHHVCRRFTADITNYVWLCECTDRPRCDGRRRKSWAIRGSFRRPRFWRTMWQLKSLLNAAHQPHG